MTATRSRRHVWVLVEPLTSPLSPSPRDGLRVALLSYRGHPFVGGQGVYVRHLSRALTELGHRVTVIGGAPYPHLDERVELVQLPSLGLYTERFPWVIPMPWHFRSPIDVLEYGLMATAYFAEPMTFSLRAWRWLRGRTGDFDVVHDNQCLGYGLLGIQRTGLPLVASFHHPIAIDRELDMATATTRRRRLQLHRWYAFTGMQRRVVGRLPTLITGSTQARDDIVRVCGVDPHKLTIVPYGVDTGTFRPRPDVARVGGRILTTTSSDVPLKGLIHLLEAVAKLRTDHTDVELVIVGKLLPKSSVPAHLARLGLEGSVRFVSGISDDELAELYASSAVAVVPSLYEGFSLPAAEAMSCATPLVTTTAGAIPEVVGADGEAALLVAPGDAGALAGAIGTVLRSPQLGERIGAAGRHRVLERFTWEATARATADVYRAALASPSHSPMGTPSRST